MKLSQSQFRSRQTQFCRAVFSGSVASSTGYAVFPCLHVRVSSWFLSVLGLCAWCVARSSWACYTWISNCSDGRKFEAGRRWTFYFRSECRWYDFAEDSGEILIEREGHGVDGQITNSLSLSDAPGLGAEGRWPWIRALVVFFASRELQEERVMRVAFV